VADTEQLSKLREGVAAWNTWRDEQARAEINLREADLGYANLSGAYLRYANLSGAYLCYANMRYANLSGANMRWANLSDANMRYANLSDADLYGANLRYADLYEANLSYANLSGADLSRARIDWASHTLLAELLRQQAGDDWQRRAIAGLITASTDWCWDEFMALPLPEDVTSWALGVLRPYAEAHPYDCPPQLTRALEVPRG
jgi:hypothetical protein